ncbi:MAG: hypothetical protein WA744_12800, partial [Candidatus Acidiferrales bacterium]
SVGWYSGPILFYHIYCMITIPKMGIGVDRAGLHWDDYCSLAYSDLAAISRGMLGSASFQSARKSL